MSPANEGLGYYRHGVFHGGGLVKGTARALAPLPVGLRLAILAGLVLVALAACTAIMATEPDWPTRPSTCADPSVPECQVVAP